MDFKYSQEQTALKEAAARLFSARFTDEFRKAFAREGQPYDRALWAALAEAGILGTTIGTSQGGSGLGLTELALVLEEQGRTLAAVPLFATLVLGALPLQRFGTAAQRALLSRVAAGELLLTAALEEEGATDPLEPATFARRISGGWRLSGVKTFVPYALQAQYLLVSARTETQGASLFVLPRESPGMQVAPQRSTSGEPQGHVTLTDVVLAAHDVLGRPNCCRSLT